MTLELPTVTKHPYQVE